jgi:hypothetical protein
VTTLDALNTDYRDVLRAMCAAKVEFLVVGAYAVSFHGHPRATGDFDLLVRPTSDNAERVYVALADFGAPLRNANVTAADFSRPETVYQIGQTPRRIDVLTSITGVDFATAWQGRQIVKWQGYEVAFLGREALLANKRATARPKDLEDVRALEGRHPKR